MSKEPVRFLANKIIGEVAIKHGLFVADLIGPRTWPEVVAARREAAERISAEVSPSPSFIGRCLKRNHSTVLSLLGRSKKPRRRPGLVAV